MPLFLIVLCLLPALASALPCDDKPNRYRNRDVFPTLKETPNLVFGQNKNPLFNDQAITLSLDLFEPAADTCSRRPVIIFLWGGGFQGGQRQNETGTCRAFARRGFVCVTADYRKGVSGVSTPYNYATPAFMSTQDTRAAVRYLRKHAALHRLDTSLIYVGGCSSGAFAASWTGYLDQEAEIPAMVEPKAREGGIEGLGGNPGFSSKFAGVLALSGAVYDTNWIKRGDIPYAAVQCAGDPLVNPDSGAYSGLRYYGGDAIAIRMRGLGIPVRVRTFPGNCHCPHPRDASGLDSTEDFFAKSAYEFMQLQATPARLAPLLSRRDFEAALGQGKVYDMRGARIKPSESRFRMGLFFRR